MGTLKYAILGLLNRNEMTGYELSKEFETTLFEFWNAKHSQIYPELKSLNAEGLIQYRVEITGNVLEKKVYTITDEGRRDFSEWEETLCPIQTAERRLQEINAVPEGGCRSSQKDCVPPALEHISDNGTISFNGTKNTAKAGTSVGGTAFQRDGMAIELPVCRHSSRSAQKGAPVSTLHTNNQNAGRIRDKAFPHKCDLIQGVRHTVNASIQIQTAAVAADALLRLKILHIPSVQPTRLDWTVIVCAAGRLELGDQLAQGLICAFALRDAHHRLLRELFCLGETSLGQKAAHGFNALARIRIDAVYEAAGIDCVVVERPPVLNSAAKTHGSHRAVSQGQRMVPVSRRLLIPKLGHRILPSLPASSRLPQADDATEKYKPGEDFSTS